MTVGFTLAGTMNEGPRLFNGVGFRRATPAAAVPIIKSRRFILGSPFCGTAAYLPPCLKLTDPRVCPPSVNCEVRFLGRARSRDPIGHRYLQYITTGLHVGERKLRCIGKTRDVRFRIYFN